MMLCWIGKFSKKNRLSRESEKFKGKVQRSTSHASALGVSQKTQGYEFKSNALERAIASTDKTSTMD
ncbi:MAG: hypothetical protein RLZZ435_3651 [Cyanobacteriota bacterium]|jgi:hypothetical protein